MENLNLYEILKEHKNEIFYSPLCGDVKCTCDLKHTNIENIIINTIDDNFSVSLNKYGKFTDTGELLIFPSKEQKDWKKWIKENKVINYADVAKSMFKNGYYYINASGNIYKSHLCNEFDLYDANNAKSEKQLQKLLSINMLMNVQKYIEKDWQPDWEDKKLKYCIIENVKENNKLKIITTLYNRDLNVYFSSKENAKKAIKLLGETFLRLALTTNY